MSTSATDHSARQRWVRGGIWLAVAAVLLVLPMQFPSFRVEQFCSWMALAVAACGLNLLTGYNGQISVGHGALYGVGAYATAILITKAQWPMFAAAVAAAVICFVVGVVIGLPALRIKGLYLALVTLAVATLFPLVIEQFPGLTGGSNGLAITSPRLYRGVLREKPIVFEPPFGLAADQWKYYLFLAATVLCFLLVRNLVHSRMGRSLVAIRDNETAAEVSGVPVATVKILTFGISSALAGVGGAIFALNNARVNPSSFTIVVSIYLLVAVVTGGAASIVGPAIGAVLFGVFTDVVSPSLPARLQPATPVILGVLLIVLMLTAPGGIVGIAQSLRTRVTARRLRSSGEGTAGAATAA
jgi:branched-chain amino acid transport system permease protein